MHPVPGTPRTQYPLPGYHHPRHASTGQHRHGPQHALRQPRGVHQASFRLNPLGGLRVFIHVLGHPLGHPLGHQLAKLSKLSKCVEKYPVFQLFLTKSVILSEISVFNVKCHFVRNVSLS